MKAITLHQPYASLIAEGVKTIETRGRRTPWHTAIGERIAIHAGARWPDRHFYFPPLCRSGCWRDEANCPGHINVVPTITDPAHQRPHRTDIRDHVPRASQTPTIFWPQRGVHARPVKENGYRQSSYAPLGVVVATCRLTDVVPIVAPMNNMKRLTSCVTSGAILMQWPSGGTAADGREVTDQRPFCDFAPGRWALLLDDVQKCAPLPCRGHQGLWMLPREVADNLVSVAA